MKNQIEGLFSPDPDDREPHYQNPPGDPDPFNEDPFNLKGKKDSVSGNIVYGDNSGDGNIILFGPDGEFKCLALSDDNLIPLKKAQVQGLRLRGGLTKKTFEETPLLTALRDLSRVEWADKERRPESMRRMLESANPEIIRALYDIMTVEDTGQSESKLDKFVSTLRGARRLNKYDKGGFVAP
jgi:hypothetical protein